MAPCGIIGLLFALDNHSPSRLFIRFSVSSKKATKSSNSLCHILSSRSKVGVAMSGTKKQPIDTRHGIPKACFAKKGTNHPLQRRVRATNVGQGYTESSDWANSKGDPGKFTPCWPRRKVGLGAGQRAHIHILYVLIVKERELKVFVKVFVPHRVYAVYFL